MNKKHMTIQDMILVMRCDDSLTTSQQVWLETMEEYETRRLSRPSFDEETRAARASFYALSGLAQQGKLAFLARYRPDILAAYPEEFEDYKL